MLGGASWNECLSVVMLVLAVRGSENRAPVWNLIVCLAWISMLFPSTVAVIALKPKHLVQRMLSHVPGSMASTTATPLSHEEETENGIGGGAINEKKRNYTEAQGEDTSTTSTNHTGTPSSYAPSQHKSQLYHALEGLDRYPNYLGKWQEPDINQLEASLEEKLALVRNQKEELIQKRQAAADQLVQTLLSEHQDKERWRRLLRPCSTWQQVQEYLLDPKAAKAIFQSRYFSRTRNRSKTGTGIIPSVESVRKGEASVELDPQHLEDWLDMEFEGIYSFPLLSQQFCQDLREFSRALAEVSQREEYQSYQLGKQPLNLDLVGLGWVNDLMFHLVMKPLSNELFFKTEELVSQLDWRHGFIAGYSAKPCIGKPRERLVTHTDDSEVTLNVCLGDKFEGGLLEFRGLRGTPEEATLEGTFQPLPGLGLIHAGRHFHDVTQVTSGDRYAFIIWARSWSGIRTVKCPCCWLNRRQGSDCVCGPRWN